MSEQFPEMLSALQLAALYCSREENWDSFEQWTRRLGGLRKEEHLSREFMVASAKAMDMMIRQVEIQLIAARLDAELGSRELPFGYVAGAGGMRGNGYVAFLSGGDHGEKAQGSHGREGAGGAGEENLRGLLGAG